MAQFVNLPDPVLKGFLIKLDKDEVEEVKDIKYRFVTRITSMPSSSENYIRKL